MNCLHLFYERIERYKEKYDSSSDPIFWTVFSLILIIDCVENTSVIYLDVPWLGGMYLFRNLLYLALLAKMAFLSSFRPKELIGAGAVLLLGGASLIGSGDFGLMKYFIIAVAVKDVKPRKLAAVFFLIKGAAIAVTLLFWAVGILPALYYENGTGYYNTFGFCHRNVLGANVVVLCLAWFYLRYRRLKLWDVCIWGAAAVVTYCMAVSRTSLIVCILIVGGVYLFRKKEEYLIKIPNLRQVFLWGFLGLLLISIVGTLFYSSDSSVWVFIDKIFTKRFRFANYCFREYGLSLFGQKIPFVSSIQAQNTDVDKLILDNAYMRAILYYGILPGAFFLFTYLKAMDRAVCRRDYPLALSLAVFAVYGMSERYMIEVYYQFPLLIACGKYLFGGNARLKEEKNTPFEYAWNALQWYRGRSV